MEFDEELTYKLVGSTEANILDNKISNESPIGKAIIGQKVGAVVDVEGIEGICQFKILDIKRD
jgi:transcription elongation factor GreA